MLGSLCRVPRSRGRKILEFGASLLYVEFQDGQDHIDLESKKKEEEEKDILNLSQFRCMALC